MRIELAHDLLAKKIHEKASQEDRKLLEIRQFIQQRFKHFDKNHVLLAREDLSYIKPFLSKISLKKHEIRFIKLSQRRLMLYAGSVALLGVFVFSIIGYFAMQNERIRAQNQDRMAAQIALYQEMNAHAQELSDSLVQSQRGLSATKEELRLALLALQAKNDTLLSNYARYKVEQSYSKKQLEQERNIAQSSKLSELAASALDENRGYAFQLAEKAWYLNSDNIQAMKVLHEIGKKPYKSKIAKQQSRNIIKDCQGRWGTLSDKSLQAIFDATNNVTTQSTAPITQQVQTTMRTPKKQPPTSSPPPASIEAEVKAQRYQIQQEMEDVKLNIEQQRNQMLQQREQLRIQRPPKK